MFLPRALSSVTDAQSALDRLTTAFEAETTDDILLPDSKLDAAVKVTNASFTWDSPVAVGPSDETKAATSFTFSLNDLTLDIDRGKLVAIIGPIGSGKSSLLQAVSAMSMNVEWTVAADR